MRPRPSPSAQPEERDDVLQTYVGRFDIDRLELRADTLRDILREKGWWPLTID